MRALVAAAAAALLAGVQASDWAGCEKFPGFGSAADHVTLWGTDDTGNFNITTKDFLRSRSCQGAEDLTWGHHGTYTCEASGEVKFERKAVWIEAHTTGGQLFGRVLCPHIALKRGVRVEIAIEDLPTKCASATFNNCGTFYDTLSSTASGKELHRSSAPSCKSDPSRTATGPPLACTGTTCLVPCGRADASNLGSCGQQCYADADCSNCGDGSSGRCTGTDAVTKICVDAPGTAPASPKAAGVGADWPDVWAADMYTLTYNDFSSKTKTQSGRFYYDFAHARQRQDFGKTSLLYITGAKGKPSKFYFIAFGFACFYVDTKDPLTHGDIGIPQPNFMKVCDDLHMASYVGRERVRGEWADHYTCSVHYDNQTIAFQSWQSLGLGAAAAGLPMALSAGDTKPTWQAPRLTTTWYNNVTIGPTSVPDSIFVPPRVCVPIPGQQLRTRLGLNSGSLFAAFSDKSVRDQALQYLREVSETQQQSMIV